MYTKFSKNVPNYIYSMYPKIQRCTKFCTFIVQFFFLNNVHKFINIDNFKKYTLFFFLNVHTFSKMHTIFSKNIQNYVYSTNTICQKTQR